MKRGCSDSTAESLAKKIREKHNLPQLTFTTTDLKVKPPYLSTVQVQNVCSPTSSGTVVPLSTFSCRQGNVTVSVPNNNQVQCPVVQQQPTIDSTVLINSLSSAFQAIQNLATTVSPLSTQVLNLAAPVFNPATGNILIPITPCPASPAITPLTSTPAKPARLNWHNFNSIDMMETRRRRKAKEQNGKEGNLSKVQKSLSEEFLLSEAIDTIKQPTQSLKETDLHQSKLDPIPEEFLNQTLDEDAISKAVDSLQNTSLDLTTVDEFITSDAALPKSLSTDSVYEIEITDESANEMLKAETVEAEVDQDPSTTNTEKTATLITKVLSPHKTPDPSSKPQQEPPLNHHQLILLWNLSV